MIRKRHRCRNSLPACLYLTQHQPSRLALLSSPFPCPPTDRKRSCDRSQVIQTTHAPSLDRCLRQALSAHCSHRSGCNPPDTPAPAAAHPLTCQGQKGHSFRASDHLIPCSSITILFRDSPSPSTPPSFPSPCPCAVPCLLPDGVCPPPTLGRKETKSLSPWAAKEREKKEAKEKLEEDEITTFPTAQHQQAGHEKGKRQKIGAQRQGKAQASQSPYTPPPLNPRNRNKKPPPSLASVETSETWAARRVFA